MVNESKVEVKIKVEVKTKVKVKVKVIGVGQYHHLYTTEVGSIKYNFIKWGSIF